MFDDEDRDEREDEEGGVDVGNEVRFAVGIVGEDGLERAESAVRSTEAEEA